jgi:hypothetical protein
VRELHQRNFLLPGGDRHAEVDSQHRPALAAGPDPPTAQPGKGQHADPGHRPAARPHGRCCPVEGLEATHQPEADEPIAVRLKEALTTAAGSARTINGRGRCPRGSDPGPSRSLVHSPTTGDCRSISAGMPANDVVAGVGSAIAEVAEPGRAGFGVVGKGAAQIVEDLGDGIANADADLAEEAFAQPPAQETGSAGRPLPRVAPPSAGGPRKGPRRPRDRGPSRG